MLQIKLIVIIQVIGNSEANQNSLPASETDMFKESFNNLEYVALHATNNTANQITDIDAFKNTLVTMPVTKTGKYCLTWDSLVVS